MSNALKTLWGLLVLLVFVAVLGKIFVFDIVKTDSYSMVPNLFPGDIFIVNRRAALEVGDIAVCKNPETGALVVSRIVALPGTTLAMKNDSLIIDNRQIESLNVATKTYVNDNSHEGLEFEIHIFREYLGGLHMKVARMKRAGYRNMRKRKVKAGYFLLGDNRNRATDSRNFGEILPANCVGQASVLIWPGEDSGDFKRKDRYFEWLY